MKTLQINPLKEIRTWLIIFIVVNIVNIASIIGYHTEWKELYTQIVFVFFISLFLYVLTLFIRAIITLIRKGA